MTSQLTRRILLIGCGEIARRAHLPYLAARPEAFRVLVKDTDPIRATRMAAEFGAEVHDGPIAESGADVAVICTPPTAHADLVVEALSADMDVVCEKPLADTAAAARRIAEASRQYHRTVFSCYTNRYRHDVIALKAVIDSGRIGRVQQVSAQWTRRGGIPGTKGALASGVLWDLGSHLVDLALALTGWRGDASVFAAQTLPISYSAIDTGDGWYGAERQLGSAPVADSAHGLAATHSGEILHLYVSWDNRGVNDRVLIQVMGTEGLAELCTVFGFSPDRQTIEVPCLRVSRPAASAWEVLAREQSREPIEYREQFDFAFSPSASQEARAADMDLSVRSVTLCEAFERAIDAGTSVSIYLP